MMVRLNRSYTNVLVYLPGTRKERRNTQGNPVGYNIMVNPWNLDGETEENHDKFRLV
jgi:hypothetical protein